MSVEEISSPPFERLTVVGLGLIGGSIAMAAREAYPDLWIQGIDPSEETLQFAVKHRITDRVSRELPQQFEDNHWIIIACHLTTALDVLRDLAPRILGQPVWVSDIGSCKRKICALGESCLPRQFIGMHPMAGKEHSGIQHATSLLFAGKPFILTPGKHTPEEVLNRISAFIRQGLRAILHRMDAETHDRRMALISHVPQLYSIFLSRLLLQNQPGQLIPILGGGIRDQLRLSASAYPMWADILAHNEDNIHETLQAMAKMLQEGENTLGTSAMAEWFAQANRLHETVFQTY